MEVVFPFLAVIFARRVLVCAGSAPPVGVECLFDTTLATLAVDLSLRRGAPVPLADFWVRGDEPGSLDGEGAAETGGKADGLE